MHPLEARTLCRRPESLSPQAAAARRCPPDHARAAPTLVVVRRYRPQLRPGLRRGRVPEETPAAPDAPPAQATAACHPHPVPAAASRSCPGRWRLGLRRLRGCQLGSRGHRPGDRRVEGRRWLLAAPRLGLGLGLGLGGSTHAFQEGRGEHRARHPRRRLRPVTRPPDSLRQRRRFFGRCRLPTALLRQGIPPGLGTLSRPGHPRTKTRPAP